MARMCLKRSRDFETSLLSFRQAAPRRVRLRCPFPSRCVVALRRLCPPRRAAPVAHDRTSCALGGAPFQMKQIIPFRLHIDRAKWDFLLHLEYRDGERARSYGRVTKKVPTGVETSDVTSGGDEGNPRAAAPPAPASARDRASRAAPENARAFPRLRAPNGVRSPERVTKKVPTGVETLDVTSGGDEGNRTPDLLTASQALSQLSYAPKQQKRTIRECI